MNRTVCLFASLLIAVLGIDAGEQRRERFLSPMPDQGPFDELSPAWYPQVYLANESGAFETVAAGCFHFCMPACCFS